MKKIFAICLLTCIIAVIFVSCGKSEIPAVDATTKYEIFMSFSENSFECSQTVTAVNTYGENLDGLVFLLAPNAYSENAVNKAYVTKLPSYGGITVKDVSVNGVSVEAEFDDDGYYMTVPVSGFAPNEKVEIKTDYTVVLPECALRLGHKDGYYNVSNFYPQLAVYGDGDFRKDAFCYVGDPILSDIADFEVTVVVPEKFTVACPGNVTESVTGEKKTITSSERNMRDFAFVMNENYTVKTCRAGNVNVKYYSVGDRDLSPLAADAIEVFSEKITDYPYSDYVVAETAFEAEGMEFSGICFVSATSSDCEGAVVHETVHQWFYNIVGNDNIEEAFLDEGITTFLTEYYYLLKGDDAKYAADIKAIEGAYFSYERLQKMRGTKSDTDMTKSIYSYSEYNYNMLVYYKSAMMFKNLYDTAGKEKFEKALKIYASENYFKRCSTEELSSSFGKAMNCDVNGLINGWCGGVTTAVFG